MAVTHVLMVTQIILGYGEQHCDEGVISKSMINFDNKVDFK